MRAPNPRGTERLGWSLEEQRTWPEDDPRWVEVNERMAENVQERWDDLVDALGGYAPGYETLKDTIEFMLHMRDLHAREENKGLAKRYNVAARCIAHAGSLLAFEGQHANLVDQGLVEDE